MSQNPRLLLMISWDYAAFPNLECLLQVREIVQLALL